ncbi:MAG: diacylglycerol kinase, partial [Burkholderiales bacterium]
TLGWDPKLMEPVTGHRSPVTASGESAHKGKTGFQRIWNAFRQEVLLAALLIPAAFFLPAGGMGKALMIGAVLLVLIVELLNSAVEAAVDRISLENHKLAKRAKDIGSAAVFLSLLNVPVVWLLVLFG